MSQQLTVNSQQSESKAEEQEVAIKVDNVSKAFKLPHEKQSSIKSALINFHPKKKTYELQEALKDVSFQVKKGEFFGIIGRNGSGKSTLLKLLAGIYSPTSGTVNVNGKLTPFIELGVGFNPELTGRENVYLNGALLGFSRKEMNAMYKDIVEFAELEKFMDQKLKNYSSGMQVRLAFSIAIRAESDILLIDEVLAVGDEAFQSKCFSYFKQLKRAGKTVVFVSHDMGAVKEFCDKGILIDEGKIKFAGSSKGVAKQYSRLFIDNSNDKFRGDIQRSGDGSISIVKVTASLIKDKVVIEFTAKVHKDVEKLIYGIRITDSREADVVAMNNRMINMPDIEQLKAGSKITFKWQMLNVFSEGKYTVLVALVGGLYEHLDYFPDATSFTIKRDDYSDTAILPPMEVSHIVINSPS